MELGSSSAYMFAESDEHVAESVSDRIICFKAMAKHKIINTRDRIIATLSVETEISKVRDLFCGGIDVLLYALNFVNDDSVIIGGLIISVLVAIGITVSNVSILPIIVYYTIIM